MIATVPTHPLDTRVDNAVALVEQGKLSLIELFECTQQLTEAGQRPRAEALDRQWIAP
jgi:hypothetical protein